ncbi:MAG TPA: hypothetical protein VG826_07280 [Pirellulales bacterium]|nr:hypothetical protein [Pirellulales bacterium]
MTKYVLLTAAVLGLFTAGACAQEDLNERADRKITGEYYRPHTASMYRQGAAYNARVLNYYGRRYSQVPKETTQEHAAEIRRNLTAAQKETAKLKHEAKDDKQIDQHLKAIEGHEAKALALLQKMEKAETDGKKLAEYSSQVSKELKAAEAENDKLKKLLGIAEIDHAETKAAE